jgi:ParB-like chromosome segregation protein Spo0J
MRDHAIEQWLQGKAIDFRYLSAVRLDTIAENSDARANIRLGKPLSTERVDEYQAKMQDGEQFPAVLLQRHGDTHVVIGGMHRLAAMRALGRAECDAYVIASDIDEHTTEYLQRAANILNGFGLTQDEREAHTEALCLKGADVASTSREFGVSPRLIADRMSLHRALERVARLAPELQVRAKKFGAIVARFETLQPDDVFISALKLAIQAQLTNKQSLALAGQLRKCASSGYS